MDDYRDGKGHSRIFIINLIGGTGGGYEWPESVVMKVTPRASFSSSSSSSTNGRRADQLSQAILLLVDGR